MSEQPNSPENALKAVQAWNDAWAARDLEKMKEVADFIEPFRQMWDDRFNKLEALMKKYKARK